MKKSFVIFLALIFAGLGQAFCEEQQNPQNKQSVYSWEELIKRHIEETQRLEQEILDSIFNDSFFAKDYDPFAEVENFRKRMLGLFSNTDELDIFNKSFSRWFKNKMIVPNTQADGLTVKTREDKDYYTIEIENKAGSDAGITLDLEPDHIKVSYEKKAVQKEEGQDKKLEAASYIKAVKYFSLPRHIQGKKYTVENKGGKIIVRYKK